MKYPVKIGIIGGSGLDDPDILSNRVELPIIDTPYGRPSDNPLEGKIDQVPCVLLARHGRKHSIAPHLVNYRANIWTLKSLNCTHLLVTTACGSLQEEIHPGDLVLLDSFIDRTSKREQSLYGVSEMPGICHLPMCPAFCSTTREIILSAANELGLSIHPKGTCVTIEGPRFSSFAESRLFHSWGAHVVNMTTVPEVVLAKEAGLCYAAIGLATDYDSWRDTGEKVCVADVMATFSQNVNKVTKLLKAVVPKIAGRDWDGVIDDLKGVVSSSIMGAH